MSARATDSKYPILDDLQIPEDILANSQITADLLDEIGGTPAALIMRVHAHDIEVDVSRRSRGNVYHPGEKARPDMGLHCKTVMSTRRRHRESGSGNRVWPRDRLRPVHCGCVPEAIPREGIQNPRIAQVRARQRHPLSSHAIGIPVS